MAGRNQRQRNRERSDRPQHVEVENPDSRQGDNRNPVQRASERLRRIDELIQNAISSDSQHFLDSFVQEGGQ